MTDILGTRPTQLDCNLSSEARSITSEHQPTQRLMPPSSYNRSYQTSNTYTAVSATTDTKNPASITSSAPSSPRQHNIDSSSQASLLSTPSSSLSLNDTALEGGLVSPKNDSPHEEAVGGLGSDVTALCFYNELDCVAVAPASSPYSESPSTSAAAPVGAESHTKDTQQQFQPGIAFASVGDDTALMREPSRQVDYLSHDWQEEDIWSSWRHITSRRTSLENSQRLENASWRTWAKFRSRLKTVSPEKLNWMKDHDVTWLYGPLQTLNPQSFYSSSASSNTHSYRQSSLLAKKPILKKRSVSELMLRRSISNSTLVRQAVDALATQDIARRIYRQRSRLHSSSDYENLSKVRSPSEKPEDPSPIVGTSAFPSGEQTPTTERRHIHFNNKVEQCIAINEELEDSENHRWSVRSDNLDDESSDDGIVMMHTEKAKERKLSHLNVTPCGAATDDHEVNKTIAMLPSTTLKYRGDTPEPPDSDSRRTYNVWESHNGIAHSASSETLRPPRPSANFLLDDDDDDDLDLEWQPSSATQGVHRFGTFNRGSYGPAGHGARGDETCQEGLRRTESGMFMPDEGDEDEEATGLFGKVLDTVNTAKDIAHVIWNVGWRR